MKMTTDIKAGRARRSTVVLALALLAVMTLAGVQGALAAVKSTVTWTAQATYDAAKRTGVATWKAAIEDGWHIYGTEVNPDPTAPPPTTIDVDAAPGLTWTGPLTPSRPAVSHMDKALGMRLDIWEGTVEFTRPFKLEAGTDGAVISGTVRFMACDATSCTPPAKEPFEVAVGNATLPSSRADAGGAAGEEASLAAGAAAAGVTEAEAAKWWAPVNVPDSPGDTPSSQSSPWWALLIWGFIGGLAALLTPCVWPMIPMTMSFFLKKNVSRHRSIIDSVTYGVAIIVIFLVLGLAITGIFGAGKLNDLATSAGFNIVFFLLLVVFAISFFGAFDIKLPSKWSTHMDERAESTTGVVSIFFMAFTLVLVSFSCTGPIIGTLLVEAAADGSLAGPALGMGGFALGLALPFSLFAFFPGLMKGMPKSGGWLNSVKVVLGFLELILSLKFLSVADLAYGWRILDREVFVALWVVMFALLGMYLLGKLRFSHDSPSDHTGVGRFFMALASLAFAVYLLPGLWGAPLKCVSAFVPPLSTQDFNLYGGVARHFSDYDEGMAYARDNHMPVLVDFSGYACVNCRKMEGAVFDNDRIRKIMEEDYVLIELMVDDKAPLAKPYTVQENGKTVKIETVGDKWSFLQRSKFSINSQPYYVILNNAGEPLMPARVYDENVDAFEEWLTHGLGNYTDRQL